MGYAFDVYQKVRSGELRRFPQGFWSPPQGFTNTIEIVRRLCAAEGIHPSRATARKLLEWGLSSPLTDLFRHNVSKIQELAGAGVPVPAPSPDIEAVRTQQRFQLSNAVMSEVWIRDGGKCVTCNSQDNLEFDHIIPLSKGGSSTSQNLRILCRRCNRARGNRM